MSAADMKKRGLGRGLDALFGDVKREEQSFEPKIKRADELAQSSQAAQQQQQTAQGLAQPQVTNTAAPVVTGQRKIAVEKLVPGKFQPRRVFNDDTLDQLAESIAVHGVLQPLLVRPISGSMYEIIAGERRWRAAQKAQVHEVPVVIQQLDDQQALEIGLIENLQREDLSPLEEADGYQRLMDEFSHTQDMLSQQLGKSRSHVANMLRLLKLPAGVKKLLQNGSISAGHARALIGAKNAEELAELVVKRKLNVRQIEQLVQKVDAGKTKTPSQKRFVQKDVDILALEEKMAQVLGLRVSIEGSPAGTISIEYKSLEQLDDVLARLSSVPSH